MRFFLIFLLSIASFNAFSQVDTTLTGKPARVGVFAEGAYLGGVTSGVPAVFRYGFGFVFSYDVIFTRIAFIHDSDGRSGIATEFTARVWQIHMGADYYVGLYPRAEMGVLMRNSKDGRSLLSWGCAIRYNKIFWDKMEVSIEIPISVRLADAEDGGFSYPEYRARISVGYYFGKK
jgi:hypothetical protein